LRWERNSEEKKDLEEDNKWIGYGLQTGKGWEGQAHTGPRWKLIMTMLNN
jgi:hypothetical protein